MPLFILAGSDILSFFHITVVYSTTEMLLLAIGHLKIFFISFYAFICFKLLLTVLLLFIFIQIAFKQDLCFISVYHMHMYMHVLQASRSLIFQVRVLYFRT